MYHVVVEHNDEFVSLIQDKSIDNAIRRFIKEAVKRATPYGIQSIADKTLFGVMNDKGTIITSMLWALTSKGKPILIVNRKDRNNIVMMFDTNCGMVGRKELQGA